LKKKATEIEKRKEERESSFSDVNWFQPREGDQFIRITPHWEQPDDEFFFVEKIIHYIPIKTDEGRVVNVPVRCLEEFEEECPICQAIEKLKAADKKDETAKRIKRQRKALYNIIDYGTKESGPEAKVWACPETVHEDIMGWLGDLGEFWGIKKGRDWRLKKILDKKRGPIGTKYKVYPGMKDTAIPAKCAAELENVTDLDEVWSDNCRGMMEDALAMLDIELDEPPKPKKKTSTKKAGATAGKKKFSKKKEVEEEPGSEGHEASDYAGDEETGDVSPDELGIDTGGDDDLEAELKSLGVR
jgi:hypothetical protein